MLQNKYKRWPGGVLLFSFILLFMNTGTVFSQSSANYKIKKYVLDQGGAAFQSTNYRAVDAIGQPSPVTVANSANYSVASGFFAGGEAVQTPVLLVTPTTLDFGASQTGMTFQISNSGSSTLTWNAGENPDQPWITSVSPASGSGNTTVTVSVDRSGQSSGNYTGKVTVTSNGGNMDVTVNMSVSGTGVAWENQVSGSQNRLHAVTATSDLVAWTVGSNGTILRTTDGGNVWTNVWNGSTTLPIYDVAALDANTALVATWDQGTNNTLIYRTNNGGLSWTNVFQQTNGFINKITMFSQNEGVALGDPVAGVWTILKTTDSGNNWTAISNPPAAMAGDYSGTYNVVWTDQSTGWFGTNMSKLFHTSDGGTTWNERSIQVLPNVNSIAFNQAGVGLAEYSQGQLVRTFDGGVNWQAITPPGSGIIRFLLFYQNEFWLLRANSIYSSNDNGSTWEVQTAANANLRHLSFVTNQQGTYGWAVGDNGTILRYKDESVNQLPWTFVTTNSNATIAVPATSNPIIDGQPIQSGDAIGVFFDRNGTLICAGYSVWQAGQDLAITAWGDDPQTTEKDGFANGEVIQYKVWDSSTAQECGATVAYQSGGATFVTNGIYVLSSLVGCGSVTQNCQLSANWNMISSSINPDNPALETMLAAIIPKIVIMKDGQGNVFWPQFGINQIGNWNPVNGYQIFMSSAATLSITGAEIQPATKPITLAANWNLVAYLRNNPMDPAAALASIASAIVIVKDGAGNVYWPQFGINTIGQMKPCEGYWMFLSAAATLIYPGNGSAQQALSPSLLANNVSTRINRAGTQPAGKNAAASAESAILLLNATGLADGDEVLVYSSGHLLVGTGIVAGGRALVTIWGDENNTETVEGAGEGRELELSVRAGAGPEEKPLRLTTLRNGLTGGFMETKLKFTKHGVWIADGELDELLPIEFSLGQNYPNPFNPSTTISYSLPEKSQVKLTVFNVRGQEVKRLVDEVKEAGNFNIRFDMGNLASGLYFYRLQAGAFTKMRKMMLIR